MWFVRTDFSGECTSLHGVCVCGKRVCVVYLGTYVQTRLYTQVDKKNTAALFALSYYTCCCCLLWPSSVWAGSKHRRENRHLWGALWSLFDPDWLGGSVTWLGEVTDELLTVMCWDVASKLNAGFYSQVWTVNSLVVSGLHYYLPMTAFQCSGPWDPLVVIKVGPWEMLMGP